MTCGGNLPEKPPEDPSPRGGIAATLKWTTPNTGVEAQYHRSSFICLGDYLIHAVANSRAIEFTRQQYVLRAMHQLHVTEEDTRYRGMCDASNSR